MENASKALIMAGSVLIGLMIIGALLLMFNNLTNYQNTDVQTTREAQVIQFNNQYETFNRKNVRGSDLYSLLNKVVDYNRRKSTEGTGKDQGQYLAYENMTITFDLKGKKTEFTIDETNRLLTESDGKYEQSSNVNDFGNTVKTKIDELEKQYGSDSLNNLVTAITKIFIENSSSDAQKEEAIDNFNKNSRKKNITTWNEIKEGSTIRNDVYVYYEYVQFKRAKFNCISVRYNQETGRIVEMNFEFTGKFE